MDEQIVAPVAPAVPVEVAPAPKTHTSHLRLTIAVALFGLLATGIIVYMFFVTDMFAEQSRQQHRAILEQVPVNTQNAALTEQQKMEILAGTSSKSPKP